MGAGSRGPGKEGREKQREVEPGKGGKRGEKDMVLAMVGEEKEPDLYEQTGQCRRRQMKREKVME